MYRLALFQFAITIFFFSCKSVEKTRTTSSAYLKFDVQYIKQISEGVDCYKIYVQGDSKKECIQLAKLNLVKTILFTGIQTAPNPRPLVPEVNALEKYKNYFNAFLSSDGGFLEFIKLYNGGKIDDNDRLQTGDRKLYGIELEVSTTKLLNTLENSNIIPKK